MSVNIALLVISIATSSIGYSAAAQDNGRSMLFPGESSAIRVMEIDGTVTSSVSVYKFHMASYSKNDSRINDPDERQWSNGPNKPSVNHQSDSTENYAGLWRRQSLGTNDLYSFDAPVKLSFDNTATDADAFSLVGNTGWHLPNMKKLYASIDTGISLPGLYGGNTGEKVFEDENPLFRKEEKNNSDLPRQKDLSLPQTAKLKHILNYSLFQDKTGAAAYETIFGEISIINAVVQNNYTESDLKTGQPFLNSTDFSFLPAQETGQTHYWASNYYNLSTADDEMDLIHDVNIFTIDTQGSITGITKIIKGLLPE